MGSERFIKSSQEQAIASWINYLNQLRLNEFIERLLKQDANFEDAISILNDLKEVISQEVIEKKRGGTKGMHGFIAERAQVYIENGSSAFIRLISYFQAV